MTGSAQNYDAATWRADLLAAFTDHAGAQAVWARYRPTAWSVPDVFVVVGNGMYDFEGVLIAGQSDRSDDTVTWDLDGRFALFTDHHEVIWINGWMASDLVSDAFPAPRLESEILS